MKENEVDYSFIRDRLVVLLEKYQGVLDEGTLESVRHFIGHEEYEMAYEGLFIELMKINFNPRDIDMGVCMTMGESLGLNVESVFDGDFWVHLASYVEAR